MLFKKDKKDDDIKVICLVTAKNHFELSTFSEILEENNIPYILHDKESGGYMRIYTGASIYGTDIMISEEDYDKAKDLIDSIR